MDTPVARNVEDQIPLPGFRFHPTDEELVSFYLRRKVDKRPTTLELIKQIDIYKHNPWDLPYASSNVGDKEWYFFCKRGRKYKNSIRPNRVTGSGFWKATGIDKAVYSHGGEGNECIGLKKTLVFYRGSAGKGTKTDWMMHEFRLPSPTSCTHTLANSKNMAEEAEIWTLCRIFKRNVSCRKYASDLKQIPYKNKNVTKLSNDQMPENGENYINFSCQPMVILEKKPQNPNEWNSSTQLHGSSHQLSSTAPSPMSGSVSPQSFPINNFDSNNDFFTYSNWDELKSVVELV